MDEAGASLTRPAYPQHDPRLPSRRACSRGSGHVFGEGTFGQVLQQPWKVSVCAFQKDLRWAWHLDGDNTDTGEVFAVKRILQDGRYKSRELHV